MKNIGIQWHQVQQQAASREELRFTLKPPYHCEALQHKQE